MDGAPFPYPNGWIPGYNAQNLTQTPLSYETTPGNTAEGGGVWQAGAGLAAGDDANGGMYIYFSTADGTFDLSNGGADAGDTMVKLTTSLAPPSGQYYFTPSDQCYRQSADLDFGSSGTILIPDGTLAGNFSHLAVKADKENYLWVMDRTNLGGFNVGGCTQVPGCPPGVVQQCPQSSWANQNLVAINYTTSAQTRATPVFWSGNKSLYIAGSYTPIYQYPFSDCSPGPPVICKLGASTAFPVGFSTTPTVSSNYQTGSGYSNGIVWAIQNPTDPPDPSSPGPAVLYAFDANSLVELYGSNMCKSGSDIPGGATKFSTPVVANGYVFLGGQELINGVPDNKGTFAIFGPLSRTGC